MKPMTNVMEPNSIKARETPRNREAKAAGETCVRPRGDRCLEEEESPESKSEFGNGLRR